MAVRASNGYSSDNIVDSPPPSETAKKIHFAVGPSDLAQPKRTQPFSPEMEDASSATEDDIIGFDMENRDPNNINLHLQLLWDDIVAEPDGIRSFDWVWRNAYHVFRCTVDCCYGVLTVLCAIPIAFCIGLNFGCLAFQHVWCVGPCFREWKIKCHVVRKFGHVTLNSICGPCCEACGLLFSQIYIRHHRVITKEQPPEDV